MAGYLVQFPNGQYGWRRRGLLGYVYLYLQDADRQVTTWFGDSMLASCKADTAFYVLQCAQKVGADQSWLARRKAQRARFGTRVWK